MNKQPLLESEFKSTSATRGRERRFGQQAISIRKKRKDKLRKARLKVTDTPDAPTFNHTDFEQLKVHLETNVPWVQLKELIVLNADLVDIARVYTPLAELVVKQLHARKIRFAGGHVVNCADGETGNDSTIGRVVCPVFCVQGVPSLEMGLSHLYSRPLRTVQT